MINVWVYSDWLSFWPCFPYKKWGWIIREPSHRKGRTRPTSLSLIWVCPGFFAWLSCFPYKIYFSENFGWHSMWIVCLKMRFEVPSGFTWNVNPWFLWKTVIIIKYIKIRLLQLWLDFFKMVNSCHKKPDIICVTLSQNLSATYAVCWSEHAPCILTTARLKYWLSGLRMLCALC